MFLDEYGKYFYFSDLDQTRLFLPLEEFKTFLLTPDIFPAPHTILKLGYTYNGFKQAVCWCKYYNHQDMLAIFSARGADYQFNPADGADCHFQSIDSQAPLLTSISAFAAQKAIHNPFHFLPLQAFVTLPELQINQ